MLASHQRFYATDYPKPGWAEQDPDIIFHAVVELIQLVQNEIKEPYVLQAVSFSSAMHSIMALSVDGKPLTPAIIWADTRSSKEANELKDSELGKQLHRETGTPIHPMSPLCKLIWMQKYDPVFNSAYKFVSIKEYVIYKMTGEFFVDYSISSASGLLELQSKKWHPLALQVAGVSENQLSTPVSPAFTLNVMQSVRREFNLPDLKIVMGASDGCLAQLGSNAMGEGDLTITIGTSAAVRRAVKEIKDPNGKLFNYWLDENSIISGGASNNGTVIVDWFNREFDGTEKNLNAFVADALTVAPGCNGLLALPYLLGERAPIYNPDAKGVFFGFSVRHTPSHFRRALLEGICFEILSMVNSVEEIHGKSSRIFVSGGFTYSSEWVQLLSNILNRELIHAEAGDASALGAAIIGFEALGQLLNINRIEQSIFKPDDSHAHIYSACFEEFQALYNSLEGLFSRHSSV